MYDIKELLLQKKWNKSFDNRIKQYPNIIEQPNICNNRLKSRELHF